MVVRFLAKLFIALSISLSVLVSRDDVASSKINMGGFFMIVLAIAIRCFSDQNVMTSGQ